MTKRPQTIYSSNDKCNKEQKEECDYKYLARVWFYRSLTIFVLSVAGASASVIWYVAEWKKGTEIKLQLFDTRISNVELIENDIDSVKTWIRPKGDK